MKYMFLLLPVLALAACDKPKYDVTLSCEDGAKGEYLVEAKVYKTKADLVITRLSKEMREKHKEWLAGRVWLYNQVPEIDDTIKISLPAREEFSDYTEKDHIRFDVEHDSVDGGLRFTLWHAAENMVTRDGEEVPNGQFLVGSSCRLVVDRKMPDYGNIAPEKLKEIKKCAAYLQSQAHSDTVAPGKSGFAVYDEDSDREMFVSDEQMEVFTNGVEFHHFFLANMKNYMEDAQHACEVADKLRAYIKEHIEVEGKPIYVVDNLYCGDSDTPTKVEIYRRYAKIYIGKETYRLERSRWTFGKDQSKTYADDTVDLVVHSSSKDNSIWFEMLNQTCSFGGAEQNTKTMVLDKELIDKIFD